jgi:hypothetical protein
MNRDAEDRLLRLKQEDEEEVPAAETPPSTLPLATR